MASKTIHQKWAGSTGERQGVGMATEKQDLKSGMPASPQAPDVLEPPAHKGATSTGSDTVLNTQENNM